MSIQSLLQKIHIYGGLACFWYLIILGVSSLHFNHRFEFMEASGDSIVWESRKVAINPNLEDIKLAETIRDSLSLMGWPFPWEMERDSLTLRFAMEQPAKRYHITYSLANGKTDVVENEKGFWQAFNSLHGGGAVPNGPFTTLWQWYTRGTVCVVLISIIAGFYIWLSSREEKKAGLFILFTSIVVTILWMIKLYLWG
jgi:hypothetical protein